MTNKFRNIYRIESTRLYGYDYSRSGAYFITICSKNHVCLFGDIIREDVETGLRPVSTTTKRPVSTTTKRPVSTNNSAKTPDNPNFINNLNHKLIPSDKRYKYSGCLNIDINSGDPENGCEKKQSTCVVKLSYEGEIVKNCWLDLPNHYLNIELDEYIVMPNHFHGIILIRKNSSKNENHGLSEFIRAFKSFSSRRINEYHRSSISDTWQDRFYDHVIRSDNELDRIRDYIRNNPQKWMTEGDRSISDIF